MEYLPLPIPGQLPEGLRSLLGQLARFQAQQREYAKTSLAQHQWPDADLQYAASPQNLRNLLFGGAVKVTPGQPLDIRAGAEYRLNF